MGFRFVAQWPFIDASSLSEVEGICYRNRTGNTAFLMPIDFTDEERAALIDLLVGIIEHDPFPLSQRIQRLRAVWRKSDRYRLPNDVFGLTSASANYQRRYVQYRLASASAGFSALRRVTWSSASNSQTALAG